MLVLGRNIGEETVLHLPDGRRVTVVVAGLDIRTGRVKLGFIAPADIEIVRREKVRYRGEEEWED